MARIHHGQGTGARGGCRRRVLWASRLVLLSAPLLVVFGPLEPAWAAAGPDGSVGDLRAKYVDVAGVKTRYYELGQGEPMVLVHGGSTAGSSTANVWSRNIPGLAKRFRVFAVDRLGSGLTGNPLKDVDYAVQGQVEHAYQFIRTLKLGQVHLVGHSAGGAIAFYLAIDHPDMIKTLVIVAHGPENPPASHGPTRLEPELKKCPDQTTYAGLKCRVEKLAWTPTTFDAEYWEADEYMATQPKSKEARAKVVAGAGEPLRSQLPAYRQQMWDKVRNEGVLQMPVLMFAGKQDVLDWGVDDATAKLQGELGLFDILGARNPKLKMIIYNEAGHFPYREHVDQFNRDLIGFIDFWGHQPPAVKAASKTAR